MSIRTASSLALAPVVFALAAHAQPVQPAPASVPPEPAVTLAPLRVTGDLWASPLDEIPASVTIFDEAALRGRGVQHFGDLVEQIPNLTWSGGTSRPRYFQIRGIGENSQYEGETPDSTVRFVVDDLDFTGLGSLAGTFDVQQVEVLRGPQAGAFGANAAGGLVRLVTNAPTPYWTGQAEATVGGDGLRALGFALGGPLRDARPDELMFRLALQHSESDGFRRNVTLGRDTNARDEQSARLRLAWNPADAWRWEAAALFSRVNNGYDEFALDNNGERTFSDQPGRDEQDSVGLSLRGTGAIGESAQLTIVTSAAWIDSIYSYDDDWTAASYEGFSDLRRDRVILSQELRLDSVEGARAGRFIDRWTLGLYLGRTDEDSAYTNEDPGNVRGLRTAYTADHQALFGQVGHNFSDRTRLTLGLRAERLDLEGAGTRTRFRKGPGTFDPVVVFAPRFDDVMVGGKLTLEHDLSARHIAFVSATRGYKGGGINIDARINPAADPLTYETETLWNFETGLRGNWLDRRVTGDVTFFYLLRRDTQVRDSAGFGGSYRFFTDNGHDARTYGAEASLAWSIADDWSLRGSFARLESEIDAFVLSNGTPVASRRLANTPRHGYSFGVRYAGDSRWSGELELVGRSRQFDSNNHDQARSAFNVVNGSLTYAWDRWSVTLWGRNLLDEKYEKRVFFFGNEDPDYIETRYESRADPRQVGVTMRYRF